MSKVTNTGVIVISGLLLVFYFTGLLQASGTLLGALLDPENLNTSVFWTTLIGALSTGLVGGIIVGFVTKNVELAVMAPIAIFLATVFFDFIKIYIFLASLNFVLATLLFGPIMALFPVIVIDYWRGRDG